MRCAILPQDPHEGQKGFDTFPGIQPYTDLQHGSCDQTPEVPYRPNDTVAAARCHVMSHEPAGHHAWSRFADTVGIAFYFFGPHFYVLPLVGFYWRGRVVPANDVPARPSVLARSPARGSRPGAIISIKQPMQPIIHRHSPDRL